MSFLILAIAIGTGVFLGALSYWNVPDPWSVGGHEAPLKLIIGSLGAGAILSCVKDIWGALVTLGRLDGSEKHAEWIVLGEAGKLCLTVIGTTFGVLTFRDITQPQPPNPTFGQVSPLIFVDHSTVGDPEQALLAIFPLTFSYNAKRDGPASQYDGWGTGVRVKGDRVQPDPVDLALKDVYKTEDFTEQIDMLLRALAPCAVDDADAERRVVRKVKLETRGFASSLEFSDANGKATENSDAQNLAVANMRGTAMKDALNARVATLKYGDRIDIVDRRWPPLPDGYRKMTTIRPYIDKVSTGAHDPERLTRRVEILVADAAQCDSRKAR